MTAAAQPAADAVVAAVLGCPHVAAMSGGVLGEVATYLPGRRVRGVRITDEGLEVHVVAVYGPTVSEIDLQVRRAVAPWLAGRPLAVHIDDVQDPAELVPTTVATPPGATAPPVPPPAPTPAAKRGHRRAQS